LEKYNAIGTVTLLGRPVVDDREQITALGVATNKQHCRDVFENESYEMSRLIASIFACIDGGGVWQ
jgi:hypothetical protein